MNFRNKTISLAGAWGFEAGTQDGEDTIELPGTTGTNNKGPENCEISTGKLDQPYLYVGVCWYIREVEIPEAWKGKRVSLLLERTKFTRVWFDDVLLGEQPWTCTPHTYLLCESAVPGSHRLAVLVDNSKLPPYGSDAHQISENTQGNWNGIIGRIELTATDSVSINDLQAYPNAANRTVDINIGIHNSGAAALVRLKIKITGLGVRDDASSTEFIESEHGEHTLRINNMQLGSNVALWDEFCPNLIRIEVLLTSDDSEDYREILIGLRDFKAVGRHFEVNAKPIFLRGRHDGCVFPLTGHPPMDREGWLAYFHTCLAYGLNHVRFHTWTPPEAAFEAADELGFFLQPELPFWGDFTQEAFDALLPEAQRIIRAYGNHPSFVMFSLGNEHWGGAERLDEVVRRLREEDPRRLYVRGSCAMWPTGRPGAQDDYLIMGDVRSLDGEWFQIRGANMTPWGHVQRGVADTLTDYRSGAEANEVPTISHEIGQYTVYPDFNQIAKYTGVTRPNNLVAFRDKLADAGMLDQNAAFAKASGALAAICYRAEIEACLRTPEYGGFEILDLQDFPGQGTALVGMLDAFMDSKGIVTPEEWRSFCGPLTLLAHFSKYVWTAGEVFEAKVTLSHFGPEDLPPGKLSWRFIDKSGSVGALGTIAYRVLGAGGLREIGDIKIPLVNEGQFTLELCINGIDAATTYPLWVFPPADTEIAIPPNLMVARGYDNAVSYALAMGERVLLVCDDRPLVRTVGGGFAPDFWNFPMFHGKPGTMGLLCDPNTPALTGFPTESHSNWQWASIAMASQPLVLDSVFGEGELPIVQVVDNYARCHKLGLIFECRVGSGSLLVCASDLIGLRSDHPEAQALLQSLIDYASSLQFCPAVSVSEDALKDLLRARLTTEGWTVNASSFDPHWHGYKPEQIIDGSESRGWRAAEPGPAWCQIEFPEPTVLEEGEIVFSPSAAAVGYTLSSTSDGVDWTTLCEGRFDGASRYRHRISFKTSGTKALKLSVDPVETTGVAEVMEVYFFDPAWPQDDDFE